MAIERPVLIINQIAGEDLSTDAALDGAAGSGQFLIVKQSPDRTANSIVHCTSHRDRGRGILQNNPVLGDAAAVMVYGESKVIAGGVLTPGDEFGTDANGRAVKKNPTSTGADYGDYVIGEVIEGAAAAGDYATVLLNGPYRI